MILALALAAAIDTQHVALALTLDERARSLAGRVTETILLEAPTGSIELDAVGLQVSSVAKPDGTPLRFTTGERTLRIELDAPLAQGDTVTFSVDYSARPERGLYFRGPDRNRPKRPRQVWSYSWPENARRLFPVHDTLTDKATFELALSVPAAWNAIASGAFVGVEKRGPLRTFRFRVDSPQAPYLIAFSAGEYEEVTEPGTPPLSYFVYRGRAEDARRVFARTREMLAFFSETTGLAYPYPKYAQAVAADFIGGGMENVTAVTLSDSYLSDARSRADVFADALIAHELAHQWWGDTLTPTSWSDLWLSEGFATYFADLWLEKAEGADAASYQRLLETDRYLAQEAEIRAQPTIFGGKPPTELLGPNVYERGALTLGMLRRLVGDEAFFAGLRSYLARYAFRNASTAELEAAMAQAASRELGWFFEQWLRRPGFPRIAASWRFDPQAAAVVLTLRQEEDAAGPARVFTLPLDVRLELGSGPRIERAFLERASQDFVFPCAEAPRSLVLDPGAFVLKQLRAEKSDAELRLDLAQGAFASDRALAARALAERTEGAVPLQAALGGDRFWGVRAEAAKALGAIGGANVLAPLRAGLEDPDPRVRAAVVRALPGAGAAEAGGLLLDTVRRDSSELVAAAALESLGRCRAAGAYTALVAALGRDSHAERVRIGALKGLRALGDLSALPLVLEQTETGRSAALRAAAAETLAELGRGQAVAHSRLERLAEEADFMVRQAARKALGRPAADP